MSLREKAFSSWKDSHRIAACIGQVKALLNGLGCLDLGANHHDDLVGAVQELGSLLNRRFQADLQAHIRLVLGQSHIALHASIHRF